MEEKILLLICSFYGVLVVNYTTKRKHEPVQEDPKQEFLVTMTQKKHGDADYEHQKQYEQLQHDHYLNSKETYTKWPKMDYQQMKELCSVYLLKNVFRKSKNLEFIPDILSWPVPLIYRIIKNENNEPVAPIMVSVLQCYVPNSSLRKYYHFIRGVRPHCLFLVKPVNPQWNKNGCCKNIVIVNEFCNVPHESTRGQGNMSQRTIRNRFRWRRDEANSELRALYEQDHFNYYNLKPGDCETWPELKNVEKVYLCKTFIQKILGPSFKNESILPQVKESEKLIYEKISARNNKNLKPSMVTLLQCNTPEARSMRRGSFQFIRAPSSHCVLQVKPTARNLPQEFVITNKYCDDLDLEHKVLQPKESKLCKKEAQHHRFKI